MTSDGASISWDELVTDFAPALVSFARARGIRAAEDLVQEVLVTAVERLSEFDGDRSSLRSWLFSVTYRRIADEHRRFYRYPEVLVADHEPGSDTANDVDEVVIAEDAANEAFAALEILGTRERTVLEMRIIDEASPAEVSAALGISTGNVRVIQARALMKIRKHLMTRDSERSLAPAGLLITFIRYFGSKLPSDDAEVGRWLDQLRSPSSDTSVVVGISTTASAAINSASGAVTTAGSLGAIAGSVAKVGLVAALAVSPVVFGGDVAQNSAAASASALVVAESSADLSVPATNDQTVPQSPDLSEPAPTDPPGETPPGETSVIQPPSNEATGGSGNKPETSEEPDVPPQDEEPVVETSEPEPSTGTSGSVEEVVEPVSEGVLEPVVEGTVEAVESVVDGVVVPVVEETVEVVETVVEDVVEPVVEETVEVVETVVEDVVEPVVDDLVGGLLGG